ncbi:M50 family metallopeptidase [Occallatibacter savannae]|uniref:M50 family metallopeptidase n=1 Tax=Occallatibacter savannae TaxID=1002691 RepID=UPI0013A53F15|nr:M50 family metallopeptidase [Occallatibacter savannae]
MLTLRKLLRACFANAALIYLIASVHAIPSLFLAPLPRTIDEFHPTSLALRASSILLLLLARLIMAIPPILATIFGIAWWRLSSGHRSARRWGFIASIFMLLSAIPLTPAVYDMIRSPGFPGWISYTVVGVIIVSTAAGISGLVAFRKSAKPDEFEALATPQRIAGDGTHRYLDTIGIILQVAATVWLMNVYTRWGYEHDLPFTHGLDAWLQWFLVIGFATLLHEAGHAFTGIALGMKLRAFIVGPLQWRALEGRWTFSFRPSQLLAFSGAAGLVPVDPNESRWNEVTVIAAGPFVNLLTGAIAAVLAWSAVGAPWQFLWEPVGLFATISLVAGVINLVPLRPDGLYSDGARILQIFRGGPLYDYQRCARIAGGGYLSAIRPKDFDIAALDRASAHFTTGEIALLLRLWATEFHLDRGEFQQASIAFSHAEEVFKKSASDARPGLHACMVVNAALTRRDAEAARSYWQSVQAKQLDSQDTNYWQAKCAYHWSERRFDLARQAWKPGADHLSTLPNTGSTSYDRSCHARLLELIEEDEAASLSTQQSASYSIVGTQLAE